MTNAVSSLLQAAEIESTLVRAIVGGISGGIAALVAYNVTDSLLSQSLVTGAVTALLMICLGLGYNILTSKDGQRDGRNRQQR